MIKQDFYIANLIARYLSEEITPEETIKLTAWREESTAHEILFKKICNEENQKQHFRKNTAFNPSSGWKEVEKRIKRNNNRSRYIKIVSYAAIILLPVLFVSISMKFTSPVSLSDKQFIAQSILPGESKAILTVSVSAILSCRPFFILIFLPCIKMNHYGFSRKSIWKNLETFP